MYEGKKKDFINSRPEVTDELLVKTIIENWNKYLNNKKLDPTETTYLLFDNLYRIIKGNPQKVKLVYDTFINLNDNEKNHEMVELLKSKKEEYLFENSELRIESSGRSF